MNDDNVIERVCLLAMLKKEPNESIQDIMVMLVNTAMFDMKECKKIFKWLKKEQYILEGKLTMKGILEANIAQEMFAQ
jgi:uncharacterized protein (UPF0335 family)